MDFTMMKYRIKKNFKRIFNKEDSDDYDWKLYHHVYQKQLDDMARDYTQILKDGDYEFINDELEKKNSEILPLHPNTRLLYETIIQLKPESVMELGCGGGDHLANIQHLAPEINLYGLELSASQLKILAERHNNLKAHIRKFDITLPVPYDTPSVDIAYTQAVLMHIRKENGPLMGLYNAFRVAKKQIVIMENWKSHQFMNIIQNLIDQRMVPWKEIYFYYKNSKELNIPHLMIVSSEKLPQYEVLDDYNVFFKQN